MHRLLLAIFVLIAAFAAWVGEAKVGETEEPSNEWLLLAHYKMRGETPPFAAWAKLGADGANVNEFDRPRVAATLEQKLRTMFGAIDVRRPISITMYSELSEYDGGFGEFQLSALGDGVSIVPAPGGDRRPFNVRLNVKMFNGGVAQSWAVPSARAQEIVKDLRGVRHLRVKLSMMLHRADEPALDGERNLWVRILAYDVLKGVTGNDVLGSVKVGK